MSRKEDLSKRILNFKSKTSHKKGKGEKNRGGERKVQRGTERIEWKKNVKKRLSRGGVRRGGGGVKWICCKNGGEMGIKREKERGEQENLETQSRGGWGPCGLARNVLKEN